MADIKLNIKTAVDLEGVKQLKKNLEEVQKMLKSPDNALVGSFSAVEIQKTINAVNVLEHALDSAFDVNLNTINIDKFNKYLKNSNSSVQTLYKDLSRLGADGQKIFLGMTQATLNMGKSIQKTNKLVQEMKDTFMNTVRWGITSSLWNNITASVSKAFSYVKGLDKDLNDIRIVTGKSADQMERFAKQANKAAKELAVSTRDYVQGTLIYYQQGDDDATAQAKAAITAKASNVTGQDMSSVSEQLTAVWNGYQVANEAAEKGMQVYEEYVDKLAAVGATTASDLEEQATAMSKVASAASAMGVNFDQINAQIATVVSVTRQAPESVGNALKTIYARLGDLKVDGIDEFGVSLGEISGQLQVMGIEVLDTNGEMRDMGQVMTEVAEKWDTWTSAQKQAAAVAMAGKRQYNNLVALFENWDMYGESLETSMEATGTLSEQQNIALDSLESKMEQMKVSAEKFYDALFNEKSLGGFIEFLTGAIDLIASMTKGFGGLGTILPVVGGLLLKNFGGDIGRGITTSINNFKNRSKEKENDDFRDELASQYQEIAYLRKDGSKNEVIKNEQDKNIKYYKNLLKYKQNMNEDEINYSNQMLKQLNLTSEKILVLDEEIEKHKEKNTLLREEFEMISKAKELEHGTKSRKDSLEEANRRAMALQKLPTENIIAEDTIGFDKKEAVISEIMKKKVNDRYSEKNADSKKLIQRILEAAYEIEDPGERNTYLEKELKQKRGLKQKAEEKTDPIDSIKGLLTSYKNSSSADLVFDDYIKNNLETAFKNQNTFDDNEIKEYTEKMKVRFKELVDAGESYQSAWSRVVEEVSEDSKKLGENAAKALDLENIYEMNQKKADEFLNTQNLQNKIQNIASIIGTAIAAYGSLRGVFSSFSAATDASADSSERMKNVVSGMIPSMISLGMTLTGNKVIMDALKNSTIANTIATKLQTIFTKASTAGFLAQAAAIGMVIAPLLILTAAFIGISAAISSHTEKLRQELKANEELTKEKERLTEVAKEEKEAMEAIDNELESLNEKYDEQKLSLVELRSSIADTCLEYERQDLAMKALISDYDTLNTLIDEAKYQANEEFLAKADSEQKSREATIKSRIQTAAKGRLDQGKLDINYGFFDVIREEEKEFLKKYNLSLEHGGRIDIDELVKAVTEDYESFTTDLAKLDGKGFRELSSWLTEISSDMEAYQKTENEINDTKKQQIVYDHTKNDINTAEDYVQALEGMKKASEEFIEDEVERAEWAKKELFKILKDSGKTNLAYAYEIAVNVQTNSEEEVENTVKNIANILQDFNQSEQNFIYLHMKLIAAENPEEQIKEIVNEYKDLINFKELNEFSVKIEGILNKENLTEITQEEIDSLFQNEEFAAKIGMSQEEFELLDFNSQRTALVQFYSDIDKLSLNYKESAIKDQNEIIDNYKNKIDELKNQQNLATNVFKNMDADTRHNSLDKMRNVEDAGVNAGVFAKDEDLNTRLIKTYKLSKENPNSLNKMEQDYLEKFNDEYGEDFFSNIDGIENLDNIDFSQIEKDIETYEEALGNAQAELVSMSKKTEEYENTIKFAKESQDSWVNSLDKLHGTYDSLTNVIGDYNEQGYITQDNLQTLLSLSSEELKYLEFENGQMTLNTDLMRANGLAMIENAKAMVMEELQYKLLAISQNDLAAAGYKSTEVLNLETEQIKEATIAATQGQAAFDRLVISNAQLSGLDISLITEEQRKVAEQATEEARKKMLMLEEAGKNLFSSTRKVDKDDLLKIDEEIDRYWEINHTLQEIEETMSDLKRTQDKLHGKELIQSLKAENKLIGEQTKAYKQLYKEQQLEEKDLREQLSHLGVDFYENGGIANYEEAMKAAMDRTNAALQDNTITDESRDRISKQYDKFVDLIKQYDELFTEKMNDTLNKIEENKLLELENNFKAWDTAIELELDLTEGKRQWEDFINEIDNDIKAVFSDLGGDLSAIENKANLYSGDNGDIAINLKAMQDVMAEIDKLERGESSDMFASISEGQKTLRELFDQTQASALSLKDLFAEAWDVYLEGIDQSAEKFDKVQEAYENINEQLEHEKELIELIYGTEAYDKISGIYQAQTYNSLSRIESLKTEVDLYQSLYDQAEAGTTEQLSYYEKLQEAQSELNDEATNYINLLKNDYANTINSILKNFETSITGGGTFDDLSEEWNRIQEKSDKYLDSVEGLYEIQKFANTMQDSISAETSLKNQQKLQALYDKELEYLREKENLTQYDLDAAEARYQITLKEIALEEARNSKDSMKLTRGADGNWSYQYVADEENMMNKQQELSDAYNNLYQLSKTAYESNLDSLMQLQNDFVTKSQEIANSQVLNEEQKKAKLEKLQQEYYEDYNLLAQENTLYRNDLEIAASLMLMDLRDQDEANYEAMTENEKKLTDSLRDHNINDYDDIYNASEETYTKIRDNADIVMGKTLVAWNGKAQAMADKWNDDNGESVKVLVGNAVSEMGSAIDTLADKTRTGMETAGKEVENLGKNFGTATEEANKLKEKTEELAKTANNELKTYKDQVNNIATSWATASSNVTAALIATEEYFKKLGEYDKDYNFDDKGKVKVGDTKGVDTGDKTTGGGGTKEHDLPKTDESKPTTSAREARFTLFKDPNLKKADGYLTQSMVEEESRLGYRITSVDNQTGNVYVESTIPGLAKGWLQAPDARMLFEYGYKPLASGMTSALTMAASFPQQTSTASSHLISPTLKKLMGFDTGGYTGDWGSEGRLAVLHEKELVLNKTDTQNILNIVSMVRGLEQGIMGKISSMLASLSRLNSNMYIPSITGDNNSSSNVFHITAEFPNADDVVSIKEAILSLPNIASQYISENKK